MNKALFTFVFILVASAINAQPGKFGIGITGGPDVANYSSFPVYTGPYALPAAVGEPLYAFSAGITGEYSVIDNFSIKSGLIFEQKGFIDQITFTTYNGTYLNTQNFPFLTDYLIVPVLAKYSVGNRFKLFVNGGPYFGYLVRATVKNFISNYPTQIDLTGQLRRFDLGGCLGIGLSKKLGKKLNAEIELRYNGGLLSTSLNPGNPPYDRNESLNLFLGLRYSLGRE